MIKRSELSFLLKLQWLLAKKNPTIDLLTIFLLMVVSLVVTSGFILHEAITDSFARSGQENVVIISSVSANSEAESFILGDDLNSLKGDISAADLMSQLVFEEQMLMSTSYESADNITYLALRGVNQESPLYQGMFTIIEGRMFHPGSNEVIVGNAIAKKMADFGVGRVVTLAQKEWTITGVFTMNGDIRENELVGDLVQAQFRYEANDVVNTVRIKGDALVLDKVIALLDNDDATLLAENEKAFFSKQSKSIVANVLILQVVIAVLIIPAALSGIISIQKIHIRSMTKELRLLYMIGFSTNSIQLSMLCQAVLVSMAAAALATIPMLLFASGQSIEIDLGLQSTYVTFNSNLYGVVVLFLITISLSVLSQLFTSMKKLLSRIN
jgi:putative ABC transport system permease protein